MKVLEVIKERYLPLVEHFLPHRVDQAADIGYQIELFKLDAEAEDVIIENFRLKEEGDRISEAKYEAKKLHGHGERVDDLYLVVEGKEIYFGYNLYK